MKIIQKNEILDLLKQGEILCYMNPDAQYVSWNQDRVLIKGAQLRLQLEFEAFWDMYQALEFNLYQRKENDVIDLEKDAEYYRWNQ